ncbi:unnamed protein product [Gordionus sp. m RMFG-2023]
MNRTPSPIEYYETSKQQRSKSLRSQSISIDRKADSSLYEEPVVFSKSFSKFSTLENSNYNKSKDDLIVVGHSRGISFVRKLPPVMKKSEDIKVVYKGSKDTFKALELKPREIENTLCKKKSSVGTFFENLKKKFSMGSIDKLQKYVKDPNNQSGLVVEEISQGSSTSGVSPSRNLIISTRNERDKKSVMVDNSSQTTSEFYKEKMIHKPIQNKLQDSDMYLPIFPEASTRKETLSTDVAKRMECFNKNNINSLSKIVPKRIESLDKIIIKKKDSSLSKDLAEEWEDPLNSFFARLERNLLSGWRNNSLGKEGYSSPTSSYETNRPQPTFINNARQKNLEAPFQIEMSKYASVVESPDDTCLDADELQKRIDALRYYNKKLEGWLSENYEKAENLNKMCGKEESKYRKNVKLFEKETSVSNGRMIQ